MWDKSIREKLNQENTLVNMSGGSERLERHKKKGRLTARERMEYLFDDGKYVEIGKHIRTDVNLGDIERKPIVGDGVITGCGMVKGRKVYAVAQDCTVYGGSGGSAHVEKMCRALELAIKNNTPIVFLCDSGGARIEEGIVSLAAYSRLFKLNTQASGQIPQIAAIMGNCAGGSSYSPAMCDFVFMVEGQGQFFITGPRVVKALTGESITLDELGGKDTHAKYSGQVHFLVQDDKECIDRIRELIDYIVRDEEKCLTKDKVNYYELGKQLESIVPESSKKGYDVREVINRILDVDSFLEIQSGFAQNMVVGLAKLDGKTIGVVANQPNYLGGAIDCDASDKCARFVRTCDCFDIPLLVFVDVPGFYPGLKSERNGILRHGCKIIYAFAEATVPKVSIILRKGYGGAYCAMNSKDLGADFVFGWPICEIAVMGADGAVDVLFHKEIENADNIEEAKKYREKKIRDYEEKYLNPYFAASYGMIDEVILPENTRNKLTETFSELTIPQNTSRKKKHGNISM